MGVVATNVSVLERPVYGTSEAARLLGLRADRVRAWLDGYRRQGTDYPPVIREASTGDDIVMWGEFVELGYLREYRRCGVSLQRLRPVIDELRREFDTPYPLATTRPYVMDGKELVLEVQERNDLPPAIAIVIRSGQQLMLTEGASRFLRKIEFDQHEIEARRLHPAGPTSPVVIDPLIRFGQPHVAGVATERLWELFDAGEAVDEIASAYEIGVELVGAGIAYEEQQRSLVA